MGDLNNIDVNNSAFIIHTLEDTYCPDGPEAACAGGSREACAVIVPVR